jgi:conjugative relaxase-like TrwC/TraI family protein
MLTISKVGGAGGDAERYYSELEDYHQRGTSGGFGVWWGRGAETLGLSGRVEHEHFLHLFNGYSPDGTQTLVQNAGDPNRRSGFDLTWSAPKDVSTVYAAAAAELKALIERAVFDAAGDGLRYIEETASFTRRGKGGTEREETSLVAALYEHAVNRNEQVQLHVHSVVFNVAQRDDGTQGTIDAGYLYVHKMAGGAVFRASLSERLERLGFSVERDGQAFGIVGVSKELSNHFSKRSDDIEDVLGGLRSEFSAKAKERAALETRKPKRDIDREELFAEWEATCREHGLTAERARELAGHRTPERDKEKELREAIEHATERASQGESYWTTRKLLQYVAEESQGRGLTAADIRDGLERHLSRSEELVRVGRDDRHEEFWTTKENFELEKKLLASVEGMKNRNNHAVRDAVLDGVFDARSTIKDEQKEAVRHITQDEGAVKVVAGKAGTGKTYMLDAARLAWELEGYKVYGAAIAGVAAEGLRKDAHIPSDTLAKRLMDLEKGPLEEAKHHAAMTARAASGKTTWAPPERFKLDEKSILVIDEAGQVPTQMMAKVVEHVERSGAKLILIGDSGQLQPILAGNPFLAFERRLGSATLQEITRQRDEKDREMVRQFSRGEAFEALAGLAERGLVTITPKRRDAYRAVVEDWSRVNDPEKSLCLTPTNNEALIINLMCQDVRERAGELGSASAKVEGVPIWTNDRVVFGKNDRRLHVKNGDLGTVLAIDERKNTMTVRLDRDDIVTVGLDDYSHVRLAYAITCHKAQGKTTENAFALVGGSMTDRELTYVVASRARGETRLYCDRLEAGEGLEDLVRCMSKSRQKELAVDRMDEPKPTQIVQQRPSFYEGPTQERGL